MSTRYIEKDNIDEVEFSTDQWDRVEDSTSGARIYTATADGAGVVVRFRPPRASQTHAGLKAGTTFVRNKDGSWSIKELK